MERLNAGLRSPLFAGIAREDLGAMLGCLSYHLSSYKKGASITLEQEHMRHIGIILSGAVDMVK